ncbi:hypothetical protein ANANG_G00257270 [Anguilla anguilla]|uniref:Uncharacterized protein n=1 Tax=Anguilla anguilla TaxID=7936 RepID=A0A9D3RNA8_ANGAN|nr:hypothetical protein ANANG_G00257270 [Anguilla anguilla]
MDIASELCEELFSWLKQRKLCKQQLMTLAQKLENLREEMNKGLKSAAKGSAKVVANCTAQALGGALGLAISLPELIKNCNEMVGNNHVTEASQALREAAQAIEQARQELKTKLDAIQKKLRDIARVRDHLRNLGPYKSSISESDEEIVNYAMDNCNSDVKQWLQGQFQQAMFLNLFRFFMNDLLNTLKEREEEIQRKARNEHIHLVFVAHGNITSNFLPACYLMPFQSIKDVILYSPWNCAIDAKAACGIATGRIKPNQRVFHNYNRNHIPSDLPQSWNSMRSAGSDKIPKILLNAVGSDEEVWRKFSSLKNSHKLKVEDRIILPYLVPPGVGKNLFPEVPFEVITCVVAFIFMFFTRLKVTIHLAACLSSGPEDFVFGQWSGQYAWVYDNTWMTTNYMDFDEDVELYDAFRALFGEVS